MDSFSLSSISVGSVTWLSSYLTYKCMKPPVPVQKQRNENVRDSLKDFHLFALVSIYRKGFLALTIWHGLVAIQGNFALATSPGFPVNPILFSWNKTSFLVYIVICVGAAFRLRAINELGPNFTYDLREPSHLQTTGLYAYVQHPSYTAAIINVVGSAAWFLRTDGVLAMVLPLQVLELGCYWNAFVAIAVPLTSYITLRARVIEEETMLKKRFGKEWEEWHGKTARFVPFLF